MNDSPLEPWQILASIRDNYYGRARWRKILSGQALMETLGARVPTDAEAARILAGTPSAESREALRNPAIQKALAVKLCLPGDIFTFHAKRLDDWIAQNKPRAGISVQSDCFFIPDPRNLGNLTLHAVESTQMDYMTQQVCNSHRSRVLWWTTPEPVGVGLLAYAAALELIKNPRSGVRETYMLRPFADFTRCYMGAREEQKELYTPNEEYLYSGVNAFDQALRDLAVHFGLERTSPNLPAKLVATLAQRQAVVFALNAEFFPKPAPPGNLMVKVLREITRSGGVPGQGKPPLIVLVGGSRVDIPKAGAIDSVDIKEQMESSAKKLYANSPSQKAARAKKAKIRASFFGREWDRYRRIRGIDTDDWLGSRLRMAEWFYAEFYQENARPWVWPSSIRMRAFLASNYATRSFFDPTQGWTRLADMPFEHLPIEIRLLLDEIVVYVKTIHDRSGSSGSTLLRAQKQPNKARARHPELRALRWISTSQYWLSDSCVVDLTRAFDVDDHLFMEAVNEFPSLIGPPGKRLWSDLATKAIVQERWLLQDADSRRLAHYTVAKHLWNVQNQPRLFRQEFAVRPSYGRSRLVILSETLRHLMRACEGYPQRARPTGSHMRATHDFPKMINGELDVEEVVNFCFDTIFWREINDNREVDDSDVPQSHIRHYKLGKQHGLYALAVELLELMSDNGKLGKPHWALFPDNERRYHRELALAQLNIGQLDLAQKNMERLLDSIPRDEDYLLYLDAQLDLIVILAARARVKTARVLLERIASDLAKLPPVAEADDSPRARAYKNRRRQLRYRINGLAGHLSYLVGDHAAAAARLSKMRLKDLLRYELAYPYIATLGAMGELEKARKYARAGRHRSAKRRYHHERLGYKIAFAHATRKLDRAQEAEEELDEVYDYILSEGCSERTYLAFLLEAGRVLMAQGKSARAYYVYLRPCINRADSLGYIRNAEAALRHARKALEMIPSEIANCNHSDTFAEKLAFRVRLGDENMPSGVDKYAAKYAFRKFEPDRWYPLGSQESAIADQVAQLDEIAARILTAKESDNPTCLNTIRTSPPSLTGSIQEPASAQPSQLPDTVAAAQ